MKNRNNKLIAQNTDKFQLGSKYNVANQFGHIYIGFKVFAAGIEYYFVKNCKIVITRAKD